MTEIKKELKQDNVSIKANAVSKLTYVSLNWIWPVLYLVLAGLASGCVFNTLSSCGNPTLVRWEVSSLYNVISLVVITIVFL